MEIRLLPLIVAFGLLVGCEESSADKKPAVLATPPAAAAAKPAAPAPAPPPPPPVVVQQTAPPAASANAKPPETPPPGMTAEKADVGSGAKGRGYGEGIITTPVATYFAARERIMFTIQIPEFIRAYKFEHDFKGPKSNEEFMEKIIKKNGVHLPELPPGHKYWYDAQKEELEVLRPNQ